MTRIQDSFTRANASLPGITSDAWSWVDGNSTPNGFQVSGQRLVRDADQKTALVYSNKVFGTSSQFFEFGTFGNWAVGTATANVQLRLNFDPTASTYYHVTFVPKTGTASSRISCGKVGGDSVTGQSLDISSMVATDTFKLRAESKRVGATQVISVYINDDLKVSVTDTTATLHTGKQFGMSSYANSARKNANGWSWEADDFKAGDIAATSRYNLQQFDGTNAVPLSFELVQDGTTKYPQSYVDYVVGESDALYPNKYNAGYYNS